MCELGKGKKGGGGIVRRNRNRFELDQLSEEGIGEVKVAVLDVKRP